MGVPLARDDFRAMFDSFERTAFRLEARDEYNEPYTPKALGQFLAGEPVDFSFLDGWTQTIRAGVSLGKRVSRVRVVTEPHTDYVRYSLHVSQVNVGAGEDIRYLGRDRANHVGLPNEDYWLFDSKAAVVLHFGDDGLVASYELLQDPADVALRCQRRDTAWREAVKREEYAATHGVR